ncbi:MAG: diacylglycerol kinase [Proteobacteria bacterium]|nr:MAG: diacylglycerol kinase [Pseudomonadota bacterium]QKK11281.1 MAG: diacylglycerol kinase [Pseudomonadota bacterium]
MASRGNTGLKRIWLATGYSLAGLRAAIAHEAAFRQELLLVVLLVPLALWLGEGGTEWALMLGSLMLVLIVEILNSGIEAAIDRFGEEHHPISGRAKDLGSAAVMLSLANVGVIWGLVLFF